MTALPRVPLLEALRRSAGGAAAACLDALFPPRCAGCDRRSWHFCPACAAALRPVPAPWCRSCGEPVLAGDVCAPCRTDPLPLAGVRSAAVFTGPLRRAIHRLKYGGRRDAAPALAHLLLPAVGALPLAQDPSGLLVVPVPLHPTRERERGYNQAALLAIPLAAALGAANAPGALRRVRATASQVRLSRPQRRANVRGAFVAALPLGGRHVLLVDDVTTTGSTLGSAAAACLAAGAAAAYAVTLARDV